MDETLTDAEFINQIKWLLKSIDFNIAENLDTSALRYVLSNFTPDILALAERTVAEAENIILKAAVEQWEACERERDRHRAKRQGARPKEEMRIGMGE